jgi:hypothetical protein
LTSSGGDFMEVEIITPMGTKNTAAKKINAA